MGLRPNRVGDLLEWPAAADELNVVAKVPGSGDRWFEVGSY